MVKILLPNSMDAKATHHGRGVALKRPHHRGEVRRRIEASKYEVAMIWHETVGIDVRRSAPAIAPKVGKREG